MGSPETVQVDQRGTGARATFTKRSARDQFEHEVSMYLRDAWLNVQSFGDPISEGDIVAPYDIRLEAQGSRLNMVADTMRIKGVMMRAAKRRLTRPAHHWVAGQTGTFLSRAKALGDLKTTRDEGDPRLVGWAKLATDWLVLCHVLLSPVSTKRLRKQVLATWQRGESLEPFWELREQH